jgi:hypothetical protein
MSLEGEAARNPQRRSMSDKVPAGDLLIVKKAIITAAARSQRELPLQTLIDGEGNKKSGSVSV